MRRSLSAAVLVVVLAVASSAAFGQEPKLVGEMEAQKIVLDGENHEIAVPADRVYPRDTVEYTLRYRNSGTAPASGVSLVGPIPQGTAFLDESATEVRGATPLFSIDGGKTYREAPVTYVVVNEHGEREIRNATPEMITHVKWMINGALDIGQELTVSYRVQVK